MKLIKILLPVIMLVLAQPALANHFGMFFSSMFLRVGSAAVRPGLSCKDIYTRNTVSVGKSGVYWIKPSAAAAFQVYCNMVDNGGGWTLVANAAQTVTSYSTTPSISISGSAYNLASNFNIVTIYSDWQTSDKMISVNGTTIVPGAFALSSSLTWTNPTYGYPAYFSINFGASPGAWGGYGYPMSLVGNPNHGSSSWCSGGYGYLNFNANTSPQPGVSSWQGGCNSGYYWKDNFSWQIWSK
jgi:hypothetical protein